MKITKFNWRFIRQCVLSVQCGIIYSPAGLHDHIWVFKLRTAKNYFFICLENP